MTHTTRVERHILIDMLSGSCGALLIGGLLQKSWVYVGIGLAVAFALLLLERENIHREETPAAPKIDGLILSKEVVTILEQRAVMTLSTISEDQKEVYAAGLKDGSAVLAQYILDESKESE